MVKCEPKTEQASPRITWEVASGAQVIAPGEVHLYGGRLDISEAELRQLGATLSEAEHQRASRFRFDLHRNRFIAGRGLLRHILSLYLGNGSGSIEFVLGAHGKPSLGPNRSSTGIEFNLSHSEDLALIAVSAGMPVGVDLEHVRDLAEFDSLVERFFSRREHDLFSRLQPAEKAAAFFNLWTRKEALLKATGEGIGKLLPSVEVSFLAGEPARFLALPANLGEPATWELHAFEPAAGFVGAVALAGHKTLSCWRWPETSGGGL